MIPPSERDARIQYLNVGLWYNSPGKTLRDHMISYNHSYIDVLKMDIEGYEYEFLDQESALLDRVGQFLVEVHVHLGLTKKFFPSENGFTLLQRTEKHNQRLFHQEINKIVPNIGSELSFIHSDWIAWDRTLKYNYTWEVPTRV
jgi:hypothetical protein